MITEEWQDYWEFEEYEVSNLGRVRHKKFKRVLKPEMVRGKYARVTMTSGRGYRQKRYVHHMVLAAFYEVYDFAEGTLKWRNGNRSDNSVWNLDWIDYNFV